MKRLVHCFLITLVLLVTVASAVAAADKTAAFIRQNAIADPTSDNMVVAQLQALGFKVTPFDHKALAGLKPGDFTLIVISSTVNSGDVYSGCPALFTAATPVIDWENALLDELKIVSTSSTATGTSIDIVGTHPITAGLKGSVAVSTASGNILGGAGSLAKGAQVLATVGSTNVLIAVEKGAALLDGSPAAGRRVAFPGSDTFLTTATDAMKTLFKQAVTWAIGQ